MRVEFGEFVFDSDRRQLLRRREPVHLSRKAFDALGILLERRPDAVTKEELHARLWPGTFVSDANLSVVVAEVRKALGDEPQSPRFIRTVHRIGYAFTAGGDEPDVGSAGRHGPEAWLVWNERVLPLSRGEQVIGRDPSCAIWLDGTGVSRRHARIDVERLIEMVSSLPGASFSPTGVLTLPGGGGRQLVATARAAVPAIVLTAQTLPERNISNRILENLGFTQSGTAIDDDAGEVWEWQLAREAT